MTEAQAEKLAALLDEITGAPGAHEHWQSGGGIWLVSGTRDSAGPKLPSALIVYSGDAIAEYADEEAFTACRARLMIHTDQMCADPNHDAVQHDGDAPIAPDASRAARLEAFVKSIADGDMEGISIGPRQQRLAKKALGY